MQTQPVLRHTVTTLSALLLWAGAVPSVCAEMVTYTFEAPQFLEGETTPLLNRPPNIGSAAFRADFTSSPDTDGFAVLDFQPNPLFSGNSLTDDLTGADTLTVTVNMPLVSVEFVFAINQPAASAPGQITLTSPAGNQTQSAGDVGGFFQGGTFSFSSATPFTTFQLEAFDSTSARIEFTIDNLTMTQVVPEPGTFGLLLIGLGLCGCSLRSRHRPGRTA